MKTVLFVCLGNICRSPLAEGLFLEHVARRGLEQSVHAGSAGTSNWHVGEPPSAGSQQAALNMGISIAHQRCRQVSSIDFQTYDLILGMDRDNVRSLQLMSGLGEQKADIALFMDYAGKGEDDVPDPWGRPAHEFDLVAGLISNAIPAILDRLVGQKTAWQDLHL